MESKNDNPMKKLMSRLPAYQKKNVMPAEAGIQFMDSGIRRNDMFK